MSCISFPRKVSSFQASEQSVLRSSCTSNASLDAITQFLDVVRRKTSGMFTDLRPHELHGIQFRCASWETVFMDTRMVVEELLCLWRDMDFVIVPDQNNVTWHQLQNLLQENDGMHGTQVTQKGANTQTNPSQFWTDQQGTKQIHTLVMIQTCPRRGRLSTRRPAAFEW